MEALDIPLRYTYHHLNQGIIFLDLVNHSAAWATPTQKTMEPLDTVDECQGNHSAAWAAPT